MTSPAIGIPRPALHEKRRARSDDLVDRAFEDPSLVANPRRPLLAEIRRLLEENF